MGGWVSEKTNKKEVISITTVSVIIPVYNGEDYIEECIECLKTQTLNSLEIIFIDDGSGDHTLELLKKYENEYIKVLTQKNAGAGVARNKGIEVATGEFIAFLDIDDKFADSSTLKTLYEKAKDNNASICGGSLGRADFKYNEKDKRIFNEEGFIDYYDYQFDFGFSRFIYSKKLLVDNNICFPAYRIYEDPVFMVKAMIAAKRFYAIADVVYIYNGVHQKNLNAEKTVDYLHGLTDNLLISSKYRYAFLHGENFKRLDNTGSYYAEINLKDQNDSLFKALISANASINVDLLQSLGINIPDSYIVPAFRTVLDASTKYFRLRRVFSIKRFIK